MPDEEKLDAEQRSFAHWLDKSARAGEESGMDKAEPFGRATRVEIVDVRIPFWSMVWLLLKVTLASIPAAIIALLLYLLVLAGGVGFLAAMGFDG
jgi:hypothetical protein